MPPSPIALSQWVDQACTFSSGLTEGIYTWNCWLDANAMFTTTCLSLLRRKHSSLQWLLPCNYRSACMIPCSCSGNQNTIHSHTHPVRAEQACVRQSLFPILLMQSLNAVLMSGIDRQVCRGNQRRATLQETVTFQNESSYVHSSASVKMAHCIKAPYALT